MRKLLIEICIVGLLVFNIPVSAQEASYLQCLVIGQESDPAKGRQLFKESLDSWRRGKSSEAVELYEKAIIADHSILKHEDHGLAMKVLEKYRNQPEPQSVTALCRRGFFENILVGNLEASIQYYENAALAAKNTSSSQLAKDEAERLRGQLSYIREWQQGVARENKGNRARDLSEYLERSARVNLQNQVEDNVFELEELQERLSFLQNQEKELTEEMYSSVRSAGRYRRQYYYPGSDQGTEPDPGANSFPEGSWGGDGTPSTSQVANPYAGQANSGINRDAALNRFYTYRNRSRRQQDQLDQVRAEISGIQRRVTQIQKQNLELREKADPSAIRPVK